MSRGRKSEVQLGARDVFVISIYIEMYIHAMFTYNAKEFCKEHMDHSMLFFAHNLCLLNPLGLYVYSSCVFLLSSMTHDTDTKGS